MASTLLTPLVSKGDHLPVFMVPAPGTTPFSLIRLARSLTSERPVYSFEPPELVNDLLPYDSVEDLASAYLAEIKEVQPAGPYYIGGHCGGATIALEIVRQLESKFDDVALLFLLEAITPRLKSSNSNDNEDIPTEEAASMELALHTIFEHIVSQLELLPKEYAEHFRKVSYELLMMSAQYRASSISAPILHIRTQTHSASLYKGWNKITTSGIEEHIVAGDTYSILTPPIVGTLGEILDNLLCSSNL
jgi:thioesterase domain-containing protein